MISFRYHVVSIVAVFLALALGVVVGTTALNGPITNNLRSQVDSLKTERSQLDAQNQLLQQEATNNNQFVNGYSTQIVKGALTKTNVVMIAMPGATSQIKNGVAKQISAAGGTVTARIQLESAYTDPRQANDVRTLVLGLHPIGLNLPTNTDDAGVLGGALLAFLMTGQGQASDITAAVGAFSTRQMLKVESSGDPGPAKLVVIVSSGTMTKGDAGGQTELDLVTQMQQAKAGTLVVGDAESATGGGLIALVRSSDAAKNSVSTVDDADVPMGQITAVLALAELNTGKSGAYGTGNGHGALFPQASK